MTFDYYFKLNSSDITLMSLINLVQISLGWNQLTGNIPPEIGNLVSLTFLHLEYNQLTEEIPSEIGNLTNLIWLNLVQFG